MTSVRCPVRVIFGDTDQMGVVYYANYLRYFEGARAEFWRGLGRSYKDFENWGIAFPVVEAHCKYKQPARYEDLLEVETAVEDIRAASLRFVYKVYRGQTLLAEGFTRHACTDALGRPQRFPPEFAAALKTL